MKTADHSSSTLISRRDALKTFALSVGAVMGAPALSEAAWAQAVAVRQQAALAPDQGLKFFTAAQHHTADVLSELIIPTDSHSPGASAAKVADFIDLLLSGASNEDQALWRDGLTALDQTTMSRWSRPFTDCSADQQIALLTEISRNEDNAQTVLEKLFIDAKERTIQGYYTSQIGIHKELGYKGNQFLDEFVGCTHPEHMA
jgi:Gluconate 2-dehydrogenase subunit 3